MKRKIALRIFGLALTVAALTSAAPKAESQQVCNLLCIQGYHCCIEHKQATCVPLSQACKG